ncbi:TonB-dependent receptor [Dysgonomonas termitidis]|uniref:TonB-dependent receptor n=1 Tax=Dysgonomonas termitidis TaxID=1516126 RepID=UPI0036D3F3DD
MYLHNTKKLISIVVLLNIFQFAHGQSKLDSIQHLKEVVVTVRSYKEVIPAQKLTGEDLKALNSFSVADAIRYFSGIQVKDYGGIGGLKTVNIRSMGTHHVGVFYDGIQLGNAQNGQIDLGKFSLDNMEDISLYNGQKSDIFQPAKDFGSSGSVYLHTRTPQFSKNKNYNLKTTLKTGSFDLINPSVLYEHKIGNDLKASFNVEMMNTSGKYKYRYKRVYPGLKEVMYDTTAVRKNGDVFSFRSEAGLYGTIPDGLWKVKLYYYDSNRGLPGAIVNNVWKNSQRQWDRSFFVQGSFQKSVTNKYEIQANAKFAYDFMRFLNPDTTTMRIDNSFHQREWYGSLANKYAITPNWDISLSTDVQYNSLSSDMPGFFFPQRTTSLIALASAVEMGNFKIQGSILATFVNEDLRIGNYNPDSPYQDTVVAAPDKQELTPAFFISYKPFRNKDLNFRAFYKKIFRMPTFNDLYYTNIGFSALKPEFTHQFDVGFQYSRSFKNGFIKYVQMQADAYYNEVTDKIVAEPAKSSLYRWTMTNIGSVEIWGIDASLSAAFQLLYDIGMNLKLAYTYQKAQDFTRKDNPVLQEMSYGGQINYIPWHSGSVIASMTHKSWQLNYSFIYVGERYENSVNIQEFYQQPWYTHDMAIIKNFKMNNINMRIAGEINNLFGQDYEVVLNYPMPKRNYRILLTIEL